MVRTTSDNTKIGSPLPDFSLPATDGHTYTPSDFSSARVLVIVFTCNHCPYAKLAKPKLEWLHERFTERGVSFVAINPNDAENYPDDSFEKMKESQYDYPFPYLRDEQQSVAQSFDAVCTPDIFVYDTDRKLVYRGQLDNERPGDATPLMPDDDAYAADMRAILEALLTPTALPTDTKPSVGCSIKWRVPTA